VLTLGAQGVLIASTDAHTHLPSYPADEVVDTSGAGDAFVGAFVAVLAAGASINEAAHWGSAAGSIAVASVGAQSGHATPERIQQVISASPGPPRH
jgi:ribokinase